MCAGEECPRSRPHSSTLGARARPSPPACSALQKWWRRPLIRTSGIAAGAVLVVKTDVKGGMPPGGSDCDSGDDGDLQVWPGCTFLGPSAHLVPFPDTGPVLAAQTSPIGCVQPCCMPACRELQ